MADLLAIRKRLEKAIISGGHTFREVSLKIGRKDSYIQQYIKYGFPKRLNELDRHKVCQLLNIAEEDLLDDDLKQNGITDTIFFDTERGSDVAKDFSVIDILAPRAESPLNLMTIGKLAINQKEFYGWFNANPLNLKILRQTGDSMEPTIASGSLVIYDTEQKEYTGEGIYLINYDNHLAFKRLQKYSGEAFVIKSENPRYQDIRCAGDEFEILGRAVNALSARSL